MLYNDLRELLNSSMSTRTYFMSLPVELQISLHKQNEFIHSAEQLRRQVDLTRSFEHAEMISDSLFGDKRK